MILQDAEAASSAGRVHTKVTKILVQVLRQDETYAVSSTSAIR